MFWQLLAVIKKRNKKLINMFWPIRMKHCGIYWYCITIFGISLYRDGKGLAWALDRVPLPLLMSSWQCVCALCVLKLHSTLRWINLCLHVLVFFFASSSALFIRKGFWMLAVTPWKFFKADLWLDRGECQCVRWLGVSRWVTSCLRLSSVSLDAWSGWEIHTYKNKKLPSRSFCYFLWKENIECLPLLTVHPPLLYFLLSFFLLSFSWVSAYSLAFLVRSGSWLRSFLLS